MQKFVTGITSDAFRVTIVEHEGMFGIPFIVLISGTAKSSIQFLGSFKDLDNIGNALRLDWLKIKGFVFL
jgi:hypothetical protein